MSHWAWSQFGWLFQLGYRDFAGSAVVHVTGGASALAAVMMTGPRLGRFEKNGDMNPIAPHSIPVLNGLRKSIIMLFIQTTFIDIINLLMLNSKRLWAHLYFSSALSHLMLDRI